MPLGSSQTGEAVKLTSDQQEKRTNLTTDVWGIYMDVDSRVSGTKS